MDTVASEFNEHSQNNKKLLAPKTDYSYRNPVNETMDLNSNTGRASRRSAIPVSSMFEHMFVLTAPV